MPIEKIYLHWSATGYEFLKKGAYHTVVQGDGRIVRLTGYDQRTNHTYLRNSNSVGIACACMGGKAWVDFPPTAIQVENMCREAAALALSQGWTPNDIKDLPDVGRILTHAEAAGNRDFPETLARLGTGVSNGRAQEIGLPHNNYGPSWPDGWPRGTVERIDFIQVKPSDPQGSGGDVLRRMIREYMTESAPSPLSQARPCPVFVGPDKISVGFMLSESQCYVKLIDLIPALGLELGKVQGGRQPFINLVSEAIKPKFLTDFPLISGYPTVDIYLNRPFDRAGLPVDDIDNHRIRPFMGGVLINQSTYVVLSELCEELNIPYRLDQDGFAILDRNSRADRNLALA